MRAPPKQKLSVLTQKLLDGPLAPAADSGIGLSLSIGPLSPPTETLAVSKRSKLWELDDKHHCPVIGTCLSMEELVKFARRFHFSASLHDEFSLHIEAVNWSHSRNEVSEAIQRHLDRKFATQLQQFAKLKTEAAVRREWRACLTQGSVAGALWATYTHKASSAETRQAVYGDIHMLSHQIGAGQAADNRRLRHLEAENSALHEALRALRHTHQQQVETHRQEKSALSLRIGALEAEQAGHRTDLQRLAEFESGQVLVDLGRKLLALQAANEQLLAGAQRALELERLYAASQERCHTLTTERDTALADYDAMESLLNTIAPAEPSCSLTDRQDCSTCPNALSSRCILYVGGRASMIVQYRKLAERLGINLVHHDGGLEESLSRLPEMIHGADVVLCPTDNISHSAYYQVKNQCKRVGKPCLFYKGSGVSSFAVAMSRVSRGEFSLAGASHEERPENSA